MKKVIAIVMTCMLLTAISAGAVIASAQTREVKATENVVYLVPGSYVDYLTKTKHDNTVGSGAKKLTEEECGEINTPNAYLCELAAGENLPAPVTEREGYTFNGWWTIKQATVTYYTTVPDLKGVTYLYADWRVDLSQPKDPIIPSDGQEVQYEHYMQITRAATGEVVKIPLFVSGTDVPNAVQAGYGGPVQFYNEWFQLSEGDDVEFYISRVYGNLPVLSPQNVVGKRKITLESSGVSSTASNLKCLVKGEIPDYSFSGDYSVATTGEPALRCIRPGTNTYRIYVKFYDYGGTMTIYMEKLKSVD